MKGITSSLSGDLNELLNTTVGPLDEYDSKRIIRACGIPTVEEEIVADSLQCEKTARQTGFPLVMKGMQPGGIHKTELGLVHLNITTPEEACRVFDILMKKMGQSGRVLLYKQVEGKVEIIAGLVRDPQFGPCVMLGIGGIMAEIIGDAVFALAPLTKKEAMELIGRLRGQKLLKGFRGDPPVDREELARVLVNLGNLGVLYPRIQEIDINPLIISKYGAVAVDAAIVSG
jgi:succinyl-CoA synthetase beta subunit